MRPLAASAAHADAVGNIADEVPTRGVVCLSVETPAAPGDMLRGCMPGSQTKHCGMTQNTAAGVFPINTRRQHRCSSIRGKIRFDMIQ